MVHLSGNFDVAGLQVRVQVFGRFDLQTIPGMEGSLDIASSARGLPQMPLDYNSTPVLRAPVDDDDTQVVFNFYL
ncbi:hypothetical protein L2E82_43818 [Cichorium intybus]|uniref:Uncharacterized protein n=1 Tax=Cichorium intybus TaxID=13427 RepID=A0ACB8ZPJ1_CICIN|nr:hypothetical protein L2E82_43818 [Cichorium intybus]